ncbi:MAG: O-antigen ligase family protein, partial [Patulibacter sp.]|nr:O-antigen ligase family protein [Patulibacter sp.]
EADRALGYLAFVVVALAALRTPHARRAAIGLLGVAVGGAFALTLLAGAFGDPTHLFVLKRLQSPVGYVNGVAGLAVIGFWPSIALASRVERRGAAAAGLASATLLLGVMVLTQSRSVVPALAVSAVFVLAIVPARSLRFLATTVAVLGAAASAPWTLAVFGHDRAHPFADPAVGTARAAIVALLVASVVAGAAWFAAARWMATRPRVPLLGARVLGGAALVALVAALAVYGPAISRTVRQADSDFRTLHVDETTTTRFASGGGNRRELWRVALAEWSDHPVAGIGAGSYGIDWFARRRTNEAIRQPHSLPLQVLGELGLVGAALLALAAAGAAAAAWLALRRHTVEGDVLVIAGALGSVVAWAVHTSLDWIYNLPAVTAVALLGLAALLAAAAPAEVSATEPANRRAPLGRASALALVAVSMASIGVQLAVNAYTTRANGLIASDPAAAIRAAQRAVRLDRTDVSAWIALAAAQARTGSYARSDAALQQAVVAEPRSYVGYALRGDLATRAGLTSRAHAFYERASELNPRDIGLAQLAGRVPQG